MWAIKAVIEGCGQVERVSVVRCSFLGRWTVLGCQVRGDRRHRGRCVAIRVLVGKRSKAAKVEATEG